MVISKSMSGKRFSRNLPKPERTIIREHRQQKNEQEDNIKIAGGKIK
jgi:hypothetical protein